ncbi:universal stress protein [Geminocystis herdmanii]|uniref:universal stress protein n=1 Tax=Geminocystis herdmanii TaxID=669359 RepID=UPI000345C006|nr:universal stress protein [Geminocystis herdmanii]
MFESCLICTDDKDGLQRFVSFVDALADSGLTEITFLHNVPLWDEGQVPRVDNEKIALMTEKFNSSLKPSDRVKVNIEITSGLVTENISKAVKKYQPECLILGTSLRGITEDRIFGSTTMSVIEKINIPIMILRPQLISVYTSEELDLRCRHLNRCWLVPCYDVDKARYLINQLKTCVTGKCSTIPHKYIILAVIDDVSRSEILVQNRIKEVETKLNEVKEELQSLGLEVEVMVKIGNPILETLDVALTEDISAIAVTDDREYGLLDWTIPSFTQKVLHRSWFPVVFFPFTK